MQSASFQSARSRQARWGHKALPMLAATLIATLMAHAVAATAPAPMPPVPRGTGNVGMAAQAAPIPIPPSRTGSSTASGATPAPFPPDSRGTTPVTSGSALGVLTGFPYDGPSATAGLRTYMTQESKGKTPGIDATSLSWVDAGDFPADMADAMYAVGATPMITWDSWDYNASSWANQPLYADKRIASGAFDLYIKHWGQELAAYGKTVYIRLDQEMNGDWFPWSPGVNGNTNADFIAMWRHVVTLMRQQGASKVRWIWCPNVTSQGAGTGYQSMYPGDGYVDVIGLDGYNYGTSPSWGAWQSFAQIFDKDYQSLVGWTSKPLMIAEMGCVEQGGSKGAWLKDAFLTQIPQHYPRFVAVVYWDVNNTADGFDFGIDSSAGSLATWRQVVADPQWQGHLP